MVSMNMKNRKHRKVRMNNMTAILKKEIRNYFNTVIGWGFLGFFVLISAYFFVAQNIVTGSMNYNDTLASSLSMFMILMPVLTMRLFAEEKRQKTDQLLYCSPISVKSIVAGKFISAMILFLIGIIITFLFPVMLNQYGDVDWGLTFTGFLGYFLLGICIISVGIFISAITDNQIIAAITAFAVTFLLLMMDNIAGSAPITVISSIVFAVIIVAIIAFVIYSSTKNLYVSLIVAVIGCVIVAVLYFINPNFYDGLIINVLGWFSILNRYENFYIGIISVSDVVYYITFTFAFLYLSVNVIEKRRWS